MFNVMDQAIGRQSRGCQVNDLAAPKMGLEGRVLEIALCDRHREMECTAASQLALGPDAPALGLDQALSN